MPFFGNRVILGEVATGTSKFDVESIKNVDPKGYGGYYIWGWDQIPTLPYLPAESYKVRTAFPEPGGMRVIGLVFPPKSQMAQMSKSPAFQQEVELINKNPCGIHFYEPGGLHSHDTFEVMFIISGTVAIVASDRSKQVLKQGDVYVMCGPSHTWEVISEEPCVTAMVMFRSSRRAGEEPGKFWNPYLEGFIPPRA